MAITMFQVVEKTSALPVVAKNSMEVENLLHHVVRKFIFKGTMPATSFGVGSYMYRFTHNFPFQTTRCRYMYP